MASTDLVPLDQYRALADPANTMQLIEQTLDGQQLREFDLARVKMAAGGATFWQVPGLNGEESVKAVEGVVIFTKFSRSYWETEYSGGNEPPDCSSPNAKLAQAREDVQIPAPLAEDGLHYQCNGCQFAEWKSAVRDGKPAKGQACKLTRQLFIVGPQRLLPMVVSLPPTSLKPAQTYFLNLADYGIDYRAIVTKISLQKVSGQGVPDYSQAVFQAGDTLSPDQAQQIREYANLMQSAFESITVESREEVAA